VHESFASFVLLVGVVVEEVPSSESEVKREEEEF